MRDHAGDVDPDEELLGLDPGEVGDGAVGDGAADGLLVVDVVVAEPDVAGARELDLEVARGVVEGVGGDGVRDQALGEAVLRQHVVRHAVQRRRRGGERRRGGHGHEQEEEGRHGRRWGLGVSSALFCSVLLCSALRRNLVCFIDAFDVGTLDTFGLFSFFFLIEFEE